MASHYGKIGRLAAVSLLCLLAFAGYVQDCIIAFSTSEPITDITDMYESTVWVHNITTKDTFAGTGWVVKTDKDASYIATAAHVVEEPGRIIILHWPKKGGWMEVEGTVIHVNQGRVGGDIALIMVPIKLKPLPIATNEQYRVNDEILVAGVQSQAPPALVAVGQIKKVNRFVDKIEIDGWSWRGHSGGPVLHRKSGKVIGFVTRFGSSDLRNAAYTECSTFRIIMEALSSAGL